MVKDKRETSLVAFYYLSRIVAFERIPVTGVFILVCSNMHGWNNDRVAAMILDLEFDRRKQSLEEKNESR